MGRQIAIAMSAQAEAAFLAYLKGISPVRIFRERAASLQELEVSAFADSARPDETFLIWNAAFDWTPQFAHSPQGSPPWVRVANHSIGPVIEYARCLNPSGKGAGRIYWPKVLPHPNPCAYDVPAFEQWYEQVVRWIKKTGVRGTSDQGTTYMLDSNS